MRQIDKFVLKHELFLKYVFGSFAIDDFYIKDILYEFGKIEFRHLKWLGQTIDKKELHLNRDMLNINKNSKNEYIEFLIDETKLFLKQLDPDNDLEARILSDEYYFIQKLTSLLKLPNSSLTAFNKEQNFEDKDLDEVPLKALIMFLIGESYKEYELIMIYFYMQLQTDNKILSDMYQDLIDESFFHLKSFGNMLAKLGILFVPRIVPELIYKNIDIKQFLIDGIKEEKNAKEECSKLSLIIGDEEFKEFFDFINYQENYHIKLMEKAVNILADSDI